MFRPKRPFRPAVAAAPAYDRFQVMPNKTIRGLDGKRFVVRGVNAFQYLFWDTAGTRSDYNYRIGYGNIAGKQPFDPSSVISEPSYGARERYKTAAWRDSEYQAMIAAGVNFIRIALEPAMMNATVSYVDPIGGETWPDDATMLDTIIAEASAYGLVVQLIPMMDAAPTSLNLTFLRWLKNRYWNKSYIWLGCANEMNGGNDNATTWANEMRQYVLALREDITGQPAGTKFTNPVCVDPTWYAFKINTVYTKLTTDVAFTADPNLIIDLHYYPLSTTNTSFVSGTDYATINTYWAQYVNTFCCVANEVGYAADSLNYDPSLGTSINPTTWANYLSTLKDFFTWADKLSGYTAFSGVSIQSWGEYLGYIESSATYYNKPVPNSMRIYDVNGDFIAWSTWGNAVKGFFLSRASVTQTYPVS